MNLGITITNASDVPIYQQLYDQFAAGILRGDLEGGESLPTIRSFAAEMGISVITVKRAWDELERSGFIAAFPGKGCFVQKLSDDLLAVKRDEMAKARFLKDKEFYRSLGMTKTELMSLVMNEYE